MTKGKLFSIILFWAFLLFACSKKSVASIAEKPIENQSLQDSQSLEEISFALDWTPNTNHTGLYVSQKLGYFTDVGLKVVIHMPQSSVTQLVASNRVQLGIAYQEFLTSSIGNAGDGGLPVVSVAAVMQHNTSGFTAMKSRNINRPRDFSGKLYAGWGNPFEAAMIQYLIQADGGDPQQFRAVTIGEANLAGLLQDKIDYIWSYYAWQNIGFDLQGLDTNFIPLRNLNPIFDYYTPIIIANRQYLTAHKDIGERLIQAIAKGYVYTSLHPTKAGEILLEYAPELDRELVMRSQRYLAAYYVDENGKWGYQKPEIWDTLAQWMSDNRLIERPISSQDAMSNEFLAK